MGRWRYEGINNDGKNTSGAIEAASEKEVRKYLRAEGIRPRKIISPSILEFDITAWMVENNIAAPFGFKDLARFTKQLSVMINSGVPLIQSLEILYKSERQVSLRNAVKKIAKDVAEGKTLAEAMSAQKGFDRLYCNLVKAGEASGLLDTILAKLAENLEKQEKMRAQIKSAMTYPAIVTLIGAAVIWGMMVFVVPQFMDMVKDTNQELPWITQFVINTSNWFGKHSMTLALGVVAGSIFLYYYVKSETGKVIFDKFVLSVPMVGGVVIKGNLNAFTRTMSLMLTSGVSLIDSLEICIDTIDNGVVAKDLQIVKKRVTEGKTFADPLARIKYVPDMVNQMVRVGEQTGALDQMLMKVANVFEDEVNDLMTSLTKMIEPLIIVVLGGVVATILVAMYLPMFMSAGGAG